MNQFSGSVDNLSKVTLSLEAGTSPGTWDITPEPSRFGFIFGIGSGGLTPFEYQLAGRCEGEEVVMPIKASESRLFFGFNQPPIPLPSAGRELFYLKARIVRVVPAESREIIKAMAVLADCGDCGGGCCGHSH